MFFLKDFFFIIRFLLRSVKQVQHIVQIQKLSSSDEGKYLNYLIDLIDCEYFKLAQQEFFQSQLFTLDKSLTGKELEVEIYKQACMKMGAEEFLKFIGTKVDIMKMFNK